MPTDRRGYGPSGLIVLTHDVAPQQQLQRYLRPEERLLWTGRPDPDVLFGPADALTRALDRARATR
jgi:hypothetical protein